MISISHKQAQLRLKTLPEEIKSTIFSDDGLDITRSIGEKHGLSEQKIYDLDYLIGYVLLGFIHQEDLVKEVESFLKIPKEKADNISKDVQEKIFSPLSNSLSNIYRPLDEGDFGLNPDRRKEGGEALKSVAFKGPAPVVLDVNPRPAPSRAIPPPPIQEKRPTPPTHIPPKPSMQSPSPVFFSGNQEEARPIRPPHDFNMSSMPKPQKTSVPTPPPSRPAKVELGGLRATTNPINKFAPTKEVSKEPIRFSEPKNTFAPLPSTEAPFPPKPPTPPVPRPPTK